MGRIDQLAEKLKQHLLIPWQATVSGAQRVILVVYEPQAERSVRGKLDLFEHSVCEAGRKWHALDLSSIFAHWLGDDEYRDAYFENPEDLTLKIEAEFPTFVAKHVQRHLEHYQNDERAVSAIYGVAALFGFTHLSRLLHDVEPYIQKGRVVVFFPGQKDGNNYRLLDARDGYNYLAVPITAA
jgi:hypothetical protein